MVVDRPWGSFKVLSNVSGLYWVKMLRVRIGKRLSLQSHENRTEHWVVIHGVGSVTLANQPGSACQITVGQGDYVRIKRGQLHRIENIGDDDLIFCEIALGEPDEEDIKRYQDDYGRA